VRGGVHLAAVVLATLSAGILLALGLFHLVYTFSSPTLTPRDPAFLAMVHSQLPVALSARRWPCNGRWLFCGREGLLVQYSLHWH
jgi:hypothetical protein